jgi:TRAP-type C4-dicarboxylate transport system substrate-binding protein
MAKFWSETRHSYSPEILTMSKERFFARSKVDQDLIRDAAARSVPVMRANWAKFSEESKAKALAAGVQANAADIPAFSASVEDLLKRETQAPGLASLYNRVRDLSG